MPIYSLYLAVCRLRTAHEAAWNTSHRRTHITAVQVQVRALLRKKDSGSNP